MRSQHPALCWSKKEREKKIGEKLQKIWKEALKLKNKFPFGKPPEMKITAQGGIGTVREDQFLRNYYQIDGTGWATPFLLGPEVTNVDPDTLKKLADATEKDLYLSDVSPLGVPFNNLRTSNSDCERDNRVAKGRPGSACPKSYLVSNKEFTEQPICTASRQYQKLKIEELERLQLQPEEYRQRFQRIVMKSCICNNLAEGPIINHHLGNGHKRFTAVCPGPNLAYFSKVSTLEEMVDHIYGRINLLNSTYRPHMFIKELKMYVDYFFKEAQKCFEAPTQKQRQYWAEFNRNLFEGIEYYRGLFPRMVEETSEFRQKMTQELQAFAGQLETFVESHKSFFEIELQSVTVEAAV